MVLYDIDKGPESSGENFNGPHRLSGPVAAICTVTLVSMGILEILAFYYGQEFSFFASRIWLFESFLVMGYLILVFIRRAFLDIREKKYIELAGFLIVFVLLCLLIGNLDYADVNPDAAQQAAAGLSSFFVRDLNYTGTAFLNYPNRQYILAALPAYFFGRHIWTLQLGFGYLFLAGLAAWYMELREQAALRNIPERHALIPVYCLLGFPFIAEYYLNFEQAILPVAFTMLGMAFLLRMQRRPDLISAAGLSWTLCMFCDIYTPGVASLGLLCVLLLVFAMKTYLQSLKKADKEEKNRGLRTCMVSFALLVQAVLYFWATLIGKRGDRLGEVKEETSLLKTVVISLKEFFTDANAEYLGIFSGIVIAFLLLALTGRLVLEDWIAAVWVLAVIVLADYMKGYTVYEKAWILQRTMIILPVLMTRMYLGGIRGMDALGLSVRPLPLVVCLGVLLVYAAPHYGQIHQSFIYFQYVQPMKYMLQYADDELPDEEGADRVNLVLYTENYLIRNLQDYAKFLFPEAGIYQPETLEIPVFEDKERPVLVFSDTADAAALWQREPEKRTFSDRRYKTEFTWYMFRE